MAATIEKTGNTIIKISPMSTSVRFEISLVGENVGFVGTVVGYEVGKHSIMSPTQAIVS
jgi:hypothetical protein